MKRIADPVAHFWANTLRDVDGCLIWQGGKTESGYGQIGTRAGITPSGTKLAHRAAWELTHFERIAQGMHIDHLCRVPSCVEPSHLEVVTVAENTRRGLHGALHTHCLKGHDLTDENTYLHPPDRSRRCRECGRAEARVRTYARLVEKREADLANGGRRSRCPACFKAIRLNKNGVLRKHPCNERAQDQLHSQNRSVA